ncbi:M48 family metallopeptidase [Thalassospira profundimaris]|nr:SprT family zinc-dependent metalloprotease [Thalassospira profundimaris]
MMRSLIIGNTEIPYALKRTGSSEKARITVTPDFVEVVVPPHATDAQIDQAIERRRRWIFEQTRKMRNIAENAPSISRFVSGAKIPFRGRMMRLKVVSTDDSLVHISYRNGFYIEYPASAAAQSQDMLIEDALRLWLKKRLRQDVGDFIRHYGPKYGLVPKSWHIKDQKHLWGSCGNDDRIHINWHLIFAPKAVLEYAVVHELCHLRHRNHDKPFWNLVGSILPDYSARKTWLDQNAHMLAINRVETR